MRTLRWWRTVKTLSVVPMTDTQRTLRHGPFGPELLARRQHDHGTEAVRVPLPGYVAAWIDGPQVALDRLPADVQQIISNEINSKLYQDHYA